jgi:hypothetical protein
VPFAGSSESGELKEYTAVFVRVVSGYAVMQVRREIGVGRVRFLYIVQDQDAHRKNMFRFWVSDLLNLSS